MERLRDPKIQGQVRHLLSSAGAILAAKGYVDGGLWELGIGLVMAVVALWMSWTATEKRG